MKGERIIGKCTLAEIRKEDGAQKYVYADTNEIEWLCGWNRPSNVFVGDTGIMVYVTTPSYGLSFFRKDKK